MRKAVAQEAFLVSTRRSNHGLSRRADNHAKVVRILATPLSLIDSGVRAPLRRLEIQECGRGRDADLTNGNCARGRTPARTRPRRAARPDRPLCRAAVARP